MCVIENLFRVFLSKWPPLHLWVNWVYIVWVKSKRFTLKQPPDRMFRDYLARRPYPRDTRETYNLAWLFSFQSCASHMALSWVSFSWNPLDLQLSLSLHQLNTKPNTIKSHKIQGTKLKQLHYILSWNKADIKYSCKSQLYRYLGCRFFNRGLLSGSLDWCIKNWLLVPRPEICGLFHFRFLGGSLQYWCIKNWCSKPILWGAYEMHQTGSLLIFY